jgi:carbon storage regulator CsrA
MPLSLSRKINQSITIDGNIEITVVKITNLTVTLSIGAPDEIEILRNELIEYEEN